MKYRFAAFTLDLDRRLLLRGQQIVHLEPKALDLLALLVRRRPDAVSKEEILRTLWPGTFVSENLIATLVSDLRVATGDDARQPRIIRTVHRFGYAFTAGAVCAHEHEPPATSRVTWSLSWELGDLPLQAGVNIVGRFGDGVLIIDSPTVSKQHARIVVEGARAIIEDLHSKNGTWVGERPVYGPTPLNDGDRLRLGTLVLTVRCHGDGGRTQTAHSL